MWTAGGSHKKTGAWPVLGIRCYKQINQEAALA